jgi:hypothetical protein
VFRFSRLVLAVAPIVCHVHLRVFGRKKSPEGYYYYIPIFNGYGHLLKSRVFKNALQMVLIMEDNNLLIAFICL